jgi:hypothetical protein
MTCRTILLAALGAVALAGSAAQAHFVPIVNPSFESPNFGSTSPFFSTGVITGWQVGGVGGVYVPGQIPGTFGAAPNGNQIAYTGPGNGSIIFQDVGPVIPGGIYTLSVEVGQRLDLPLFDNQLFLGFGGHDLATTTLFAASSNPAASPAPGTYALATVTGVAPAGASGDVLLFLEGGNSGAFGTSGQAGWDNVSLFIPEPFSAVLLATGLLGLTVVRRRRP